MNPGYNLWYMHDERTVSGPVAGFCSNLEVADTTVGSTELGGGMHAMHSTCTVLAKT
jgi:hypothetical protein